MSLTNWLINNNTIQININQSPTLNKCRQEPINQMKFNENKKKNAIFYYFIDSIMAH